MPFAPSQVPALEDGDYAHFEGVDGTGGHKFGSTVQFATQFPAWVQTLDQLEAIFRETVANAARVQRGKFGQYELRALVNQRSTTMVVQVLLYADGTPNTIYPISGDQVMFLGGEGPPIARGLDIDDLLGW